MKRLFAAIKILPDEHFLRVYYALMNDLKNDKIKWVKPENIHLTLKFFGKTPDNQLDVITEVLGDISKKINPFWVEFTRTGIFGSSYKPKVIWYGIKDEDQMKELGQKMISQLDWAGFPSDRQNFVPHLTVGRIKSISNKKLFQQTIDEYKEAFLQKILIKDFYLFQSILKPNGSEFIPLAKFDLSCTD